MNVMSSIYRMLLPYVYKSDILLRWTFKYWVRYCCLSQHALIIFIRKWCDCEWNAQHLQVIPQSFQVHSQYCFISRPFFFVDLSPHFSLFLVHILGHIHTVDFYSIRQLNFSIFAPKYILGGLLSQESTCQLPTASLV